MPNNNTVDRIVGVPSTTAARGVKCAPAITLVTTGISVVLDQTGTAAQVYAQPSAAPNALGPLDAFAFRVRATFKVTTGGASTNVVSIYQGVLGTSTTAVSGNIIATITSDSLSTASSCGFLEATLIWDPTSLKLNGQYRGTYGTTSTAETVVTNQLTPANIQALGFYVGSNNASSVTGTVFQLGELVVEAI